MKSRDLRIFYWVLFFDVLIDNGLVEQEVKTLATGLSILEIRETGFEYFKLSLKLLTGAGLEFLTCYTSVFVLHRKQPSDHRRRQRVLEQNVHTCDPFDRYILVGTCSLMEG